MPGRAKPNAAVLLVVAAATVLVLAALSATVLLANRADAAAVHASRVATAPAYETIVDRPIAHVPSQRHDTIRQPAVTTARCTEIRGRLSDTADTFTAAVVRAEDAIEAAAATRTNADIPVSSTREGAALIAQVTDLANGHRDVYRAMRCKWKINDSTVAVIENDSTVTAHMLNRAVDQLESEISRAK